ncbi:UbiA family prenyltransferase [Luteimonas saliphila]|uniref:UbiA family prenyltransferase n=1 Tax=Luteimonas saliphila TaxID=2804919 RepID=UPI00192D60BB
MDLDGTLLRTDLLHESILLLLRVKPLCLFLLPFWLFRGKARLKREVARRVRIDAAFLPYDPRVIEYLRTTKARPRVLCTAADELLARPVADHLQLFELTLASDGQRNLEGRAKAEALVERFGERGFDYTGNSPADMFVWPHARRARVVNAPTALARRAAAVTEVESHWPSTASRPAAWLKAIRPHQWLKNLLVLAPLLAAHRFTDPVAASQALLAFAAFSLCASGVYLLNDLLDLPSDRRHPRKRQRPFAAGALPVLHGLIAAPLLAASGFALAWLCSPAFLLVLVVYYSATLAYSLHFKTVHMLDVLLLAGLYTIRIVGGAVAIGVPLSFWLLAFSMFLFLSLAMLKRYTELHGLSTAGITQAAGRGYAGDDLPLLQSLGGSAGYLAVLVLALYINSAESVELYSRPQLLWLLCPLLLYWVSRAWSLVRRGRMHDDPVVFAATDRVSLVVAALFAAVVLGAI